MDKLKILFAFFLGWTFACVALGIAVLTQHKTFEQKYANLSYEDKRDIALIWLAEDLHRYGAEIALCDAPMHLSSPVAMDSLKGSRK